MTRDEVIAELCAIVGLAYGSIADFSEASDCFCGNVAPLGEFKHSGKSLRYVREAVKAKLIADGYTIDPLMDEERKGPRMNANTTTNPLRWDVPSRDTSLDDRYRQAVIATSIADALARLAFDRTLIELDPLDRAGLRAIGESAVEQALATLWASRRTIERDRAILIGALNGAATQPPVSLLDQSRGDIGEGRR